nr:alpha/beta hydrolase [uncultured Anaerostipes sp.]
MSYFNYHSKKIYYTETGKGIPVLLLHGNTASSKMFEPLLPLYTEHFKVIRMDFLGNGRSERIDRFPADVWIQEGKQIIALLRHLNYEKVHLVGTSGGAWAAVNAALDRPELIGKVIADSFDGRTLHLGFAENLRKERAEAKQNEEAAQFYEWCQGEDWEMVVDLDTECLLRCADENRPLFHKPLSSLAVPIMFMGSREDEMVREDLEEEYEQMAEQIKQARIILFDKGGHPAIASNAVQAAEQIRRFFLEI